MTQQLHDLTVETWVSGVPTVQRMQQDLLSLRAAVRRVLRACVVDGSAFMVPEDQRNLFVIAMHAIKAEMAGIDDDASPPVIPEPPKCVKCGRPKDNHPYRHPFVSTQPNAGGELG